MSLIAPIKDHHSEQRLFVSRVILSSVIGVLLLGTVIARLVQLQVYDYELFAAKSQGNRVRIEALPPTRGLIFDRRGRILAENLPAYQLELIPEQVPDIDDTLARLATIGLIKEEDIPRMIELSQNGPRFKPVTLRFRLSEDEIADFAIQRPRFPGVDFQPRLVRHYPDGELISHAIGYVGALSTADLQRLEQAAYAGTSHTGKTGVEHFNESRLHGTVGYQQVVTNARGRQVPVGTSDFSDSLPEGESPSPGANLYLTLDLDLQRVAAKALEGRRGAVVAIDPNNGDILALVSAPAFDPNLFAVGMSPSEYNALANDEDRPLFNRAVRGSYPPGSTIKPMLALAALETGATNVTRRTLCIGYYRLPGSTHRYRDWRPGGHGEVDLHDAIAQSCDVYFYEISRDIGIDRMHYYLDQFGLGKKTGLDITGEANGLVPSRAWKKQAFRERADQVWFPGETVIAAIGQGYLLTTPLQLANATAALAVRGKRFKPRLVAAYEDPLTGERTMLAPQPLPDVDITNEFFWDNVLTGMHDVMHGPRGTARAAARGASYEMAGKSGTAQVFSVGQEEEYDEEEIAERLRDHALFISFAPYEQPRIAVAVIVENGSSGSGVAAPIARAIMDEYLGMDSDEL
ncbi:MAG: penicillin-binding protein 2 [Gammaproteobacteria bacterium]|nr:MAG: penicillin-binding protein 2 [Gammaproteobacteria bacterium]RLA30578.1 MAG: penicillin-binding protein 2 [Gammaproteobacteria bacterium]